MRSCLYAIVFSLSATLVAKPTNACMVREAINIEDIKYASVVVIGRITDYELVPDQTVRQERNKKYLEEYLASPNLSPQDKKALAGRKATMSDYARFSVLVDEVLVGKPQKVLQVTWVNSTFGEPEKLEEGPFLIALREPGTKMPPLRGPSATIRPTPEPHLFTMLQAPCAPPFMLKAASAEKKNPRFIVRWCKMTKRQNSRAFQPNMAVKGTRRTQALLKVRGLLGFACFVNLCQPARPLLLR
jgi:hypothetical protein